MGLDEFASAIFEITIVEEFFPFILGDLAAGQLGKRITNNIVRPGHVQTANTRKHFDFCEPAEKRRHQRLDRDNRVIAGPRIAPGLEVMRHRDMDVRQRKSLVLVIAEAHYCLNVGAQRLEIDIGRRGVSRISAEHHQSVHLVLLHRGAQFSNRSEAPVSFHVLERFANISQSGID